MKKVISDAVEKLLCVKSLVTFAVVGTLCVLATRQNISIPSEAFVGIATSVVTYFFIKKSEA
jgi:uncharacterized membrane protein